MIASYRWLFYGSVAAMPLVQNKNQRQREQFSVKIRDRSIEILYNWKRIRNKLSRKFFKQLLKSLNENLFGIINKLATQNLQQKLVIKSSKPKYFIFIFQKTCTTPARHRNWTPKLANNRRIWLSRKSCLHRAELRRKFTDVQHGFIRFYLQQ